MSIPYGRVFGKRIELLSVNDIHDLVSARAPESQHLDFKSELPARSSRDEYRQLARHVAAFANAEGGAIVFGVEDEDDHAERAKPVSVGEAAANFLKAINAYLHPPVLGLVFQPIAEAGETKGYIVLGIPASSASPHAVTEEGGALSYWRRSGRDRHPLTEADVERAYRSRWTRYQDATALLESVQSSTKHAVGSAGLSLVAVPVQPRPVYAHARGGLNVLEQLVARFRKQPIEGGQYGSQIGVDARAGFQHLECGLWPDRTRFATSESTWYCIVLKSGAVGLARRANRGMLPRDALNESHFLTPVELEQGVLAHLVSARAILSEFGVGGDLLVRYGLQAPITGLYLVSANGFMDVLGSCHGEAIDQEVLLAEDLYDPQALLGTAKRVVEDVYPAFGKPMASVLIHDEAGALVVDARGHRGSILRSWCTLHGLPVK